MSLSVHLISAESFGPIKDNGRDNFSFRGVHDHNLQQLVITATAAMATVLVQSIGLDSCFCLPKRRTYIYDRFTLFLFRFLFFDYLKMVNLAE